MPYTDPGANLTFAIRRELARVEHETGRATAVILMQNHGIIVHSDSADECLRINADANVCLAAQLGKILLRMKEKNAQVVAETLTAVTFIMDTIRENGYTVSTMGEAAKRFIANWESEKYRKSLAEKA